jgi:ATP-dependent DNA helicase RecQ
MNTDRPDGARLLGALREVFGFSTFKPLQQEIIETVAAGRDVLALMPTGGGKSLCYQLPALLRPGVTIVVSPLIALMKDQVDKLHALGLPADFINSSLTPGEAAVRQAAVARGAMKLLYVAPERLMMPGFLRLLASAPLAGFAIDEAHCISEWGHDFRPEYRELSRLRTLFPTASISAFTATATSRVQADIVAQLRLREPQQFRGTFDRENLFYQVMPKQNAYRQLTRYLETQPGRSGIVYCQARSTTESVAERLAAEGFRAVAYHAGLEPSSRRARQEGFIRGEIEIIVATIAFGMGIDKPDVRFVVHYDLPKNLEGYYQESGRAGRDGEASDCILFYSYGDASRQEFFIEQRSTERERAIGREQLRTLVDWADGVECRRRTMLKYFGENLTLEHERCCDVCQARGSRVDVTEAAHQFLTCVQQLREGFGEAYIVRVLRGSRDQRILSARHDRLPCHGTGRRLERPEWHAIARALERDGYTRVARDEYNIVQLTAGGRRALTAGERIELAVDGIVSPPVREAGPGPSNESGEELFQKLRQLRRRLADERGLPAYAIFADATLRQMAADRPQTPVQLRRIPGVGERKLADFGDDFLSLIALSGGEKSSDAPGLSAGSVATVPKSGESPAVRPIPARITESARISLELFRKGQGADGIARARGLSLVTVAEHLSQAVFAGEALEMRRLVTPDKQRAIEIAIAELGPSLLKPLKDRLGDGFSYEEIRYVRALVLRSQAAG